MDKSWGKWVGSLIRNYIYNWIYILNWHIHILFLLLGMHIYLYVHILYISIPAGMDRHRLDIITWMLSLAGVGWMIYSWSLVMVSVSGPNVVFQLSFYCLWFTFCKSAWTQILKISNFNYLAKPYVPNKELAVGCGFRWAILGKATSLLKVLSVFQSSLKCTSVQLPCCTLRTFFFRMWLGWAASGLKSY